MSLRHHLQIFLIVLLVIRLPKCFATLLGCSWNHECTPSPHNCTIQVISRRGKNENVSKMSKNEMCYLQRVQLLLFFIVKYANVRRSSWGLPRGCLSSLIDGRIKISGLNILMTAMTFVIPVKNSTSWAIRESKIGQRRRQRRQLMISLAEWM